MHAEDQLVYAAQITAFSRKVREAVKREARLKSVGHIVVTDGKKPRRKQK